MTDVWHELERVIDGLSSIPDIQAAAVVRRDGLIVTHNLPESVDPKIVAAGAVRCRICGTRLAEPAGKQGTRHSTNYHGFASTERGASTAS